MTVDLVNGGTAPSEPTNARAIDRITRPSIGKGMRIRRARHWPKACRRSFTAGPSGSLPG